MIVGIPRKLRNRSSASRYCPPLSTNSSNAAIGWLWKAMPRRRSVSRQRLRGCREQKQLRHTRKSCPADLIIVKVKEPLASECDLLRKGQVLFTYLHLAANNRPRSVCWRPGHVAHETVEVDHRLPLLEPMSEIAGRMSVLVGGYFLAKHHGGKGVLLGGVPGVLPGRVVVLGGGTSGINAARMATGLGADVTILEVDLERMRFLDITMQTAHTLYSSEASLIELLPNVDLLIGAVPCARSRAPKLISREMLRSMKPEASWLISPSIKAAARELTSDDPRSSDLHR